MWATFDSVGDIPSVGDIDGDSQRLRVQNTDLPSYLAVQVLQLPQNKTTQHIKFTFLHNEVHFPST